ncbi:hypothetical protein [Methylomonas sp. AM2-LC]|uniref:hypothetical protein n=1 Tax=Methylomonas sp. AM2-LC TaxID=3153301 RepID=UPI003267F979
MEIKPYKPTELGRLFWLAAKHRACANTEFTYEQNAHFVLALYSGSHVSNIRSHEVLDMLAKTIYHYIKNAGCSEFEFMELFRPLRTDHAFLTRQEWNHSTATSIIISSFMSRLAITQVFDEDKEVIDLSGPEISYHEVFERLSRDRTYSEECDIQKGHIQCAKSYDTCVFRFYKEWLFDVPEEEKHKKCKGICLCSQIIKGSNT